MKRNLITIVTALLLAATVLLSCASCGMTVSATSLSDAYTRKATAVGEMTDTFKAAMADFSLTLFQGLLTEDDENDLVSPLSAVLCLAMVANGASGNTLAQMEAAFGMDIDTLNENLYAYTTSLYSASNCKLNIADSIWFRDEENRLHVNEDFLQANADWYDAQVYAAPFDDSTVEDINAWCSKYTDGMIEKIIDEISDSDLMCLINALAFDAKWAYAYDDGAISKRDFHNHDGTSATADFMASEERTYLSGKNVRGFAKSYAGDCYSFVGLLPDSGTDIYDYIRSLSGEEWLALWNGRRSATVDVKMPEFSYEASMNLNKTLQGMGMTDMFSEAADFSKLGYSKDGNIYCSSVGQKTFIDVNRSGTKAAAVTWATMAGVGIITTRLTVTLDRPFAYVIVDNATGLPVFLGAVTNLE